MPASPTQRVYRTWISDSRRWNTYRPREGDVVVATYPKSGTTWMQQIVALLVFQSTEPRSLSDISPWIDRRAAPPAEAIFAELETQPHRRFLKCHVPFDGFPIHDEVRYIHVARDGRDACLSYHAQIMRFRPAVRAGLDRIGLADETIRAPYPEPPADPAAFFRTWMSQGVSGEPDGLPTVSYFNFEATYWQARRRPNMLLGALS